MKQLKNPPKFFHLLEIRTGGLRTQTKIIGSGAQTVDEAYAERCKIQSQYPPSQVVQCITQTVKGN